MNPAQSHSLQQALELAEAAPLLVGFSGGLDSTVLLHALSRNPQQVQQGLRAVHVHHGLHAQAGRWAEHCVDLCNALGLALQVVSVEVRRDAGDGLEAAARKARYAAFGQQMQAGEVLVTAHHRDDQAETFLLRALRGSGLDGLAAMRAMRPFATGRHWRPLLQIPRQWLLDYAQAHGLAWQEDPSNLDTHHDRNFLRQRVMPLLRERWPQADLALLRSALLSADAVGLLEQEDHAALQQVQSTDTHCLSANALLALPAPRRARVLRRWIESLGLPPLPREGVAHVESDLLPARLDASAKFRWGDMEIQRWRDLLHVQRLREPLPIDWRAHWDGRQPLPLPDGGELSLHGADAFAAPLRVHARRGGERLLLPGRLHSHAVKQVLQDLGIPPWIRTQLPLLSDSEGTLQALADLACSAQLDAWLRSKGASLHWQRGNQNPWERHPGAMLYR